MRSKINYKENGITMISLVVTIIVLLILAPIGIMAVQQKNSTFLGWSENEDATSPEYEPGESYEISENKILYAVYVSNKWIVTIKSNGGK